MTARRLLLAALAAVLAAAPAPAGARSHPKPPPVEVQLLGLNDFHGHLESTTPGRISNIPAGGVEFLATHVRALEATSRHTLVVSAGDLIGASPLISALFHDEPTIQAMNQLGLDMNAVGNHEFDEGLAELLRMQHGGCHPVDGCQDGDGFGGARFPFLAANVVYRDTGRPILRPYVIRRFQGIQVGFIGMTLEGTPDIVSPAGIQGLEFLDEADTANRYAAKLRRRGVSAIVVLLHEGGVQTVTPFDINTCNGISGPVVDIVRRTVQDVDAFVTGHTHSAYNCLIDGRPVTSASSFGRLVTDIDLKIDRRRRDVIRAQTTANNQIVTQDVPRALDMQALVERYRSLAAPLASRPVGRITADITRAPDDSLENAAGNLIADSQLAGTRANGAVAAFMNPGGVRADFLFAASGGEGDGVVTYGEAFTVQPFGNGTVTLTLTGAQLRELLSQQWCGQTFPRVLLPSSTVRYTYSLSAAAGLVGKPCAGAADPVTELSVEGAPVTPAGTYRVTVNSFLADGGDRFSVLREGADRVGGPLDLDALQAYLAAAGTVAPPALDRISVVP